MAIRGVGMTSKSSDGHDDDNDSKNGDNAGVAGWDQIADELGTTRIVYVIARYDKNGNQTDFEIDVEPDIDLYAEYGMLVHATELVRDVMVNGDNLVFNFDDTEMSDGDDDNED